MSEANASNAGERDGFLSKLCSAISRKVAHHIWRKAVYSLTHRLMTITVGILFPVRATGTRCVPKTGPLLIVANHQSFLDPVVLGLCTPRQPRYIARSTLFRFPPFRWLILSLGAIPIRQSGSAGEGLKAGVEQLQSGGALAVWPEGSRTPDGRIGPLQPGVMLILRRVSTPVVVVGIAGAYESLPIGGKWLHVTPICLHYETWRYDPELSRDENLERMADTMQHAFANATRLREKMLAAGRGTFLASVFSTIPGRPAYANSANA